MIFHLFIAHRIRFGFRVTWNVFIVSHALQQPLNLVCGCVRRYGFTAAAARGYKLPRHADMLLSFLQHKHPISQCSQRRNRSHSSFSPDTAPPSSCRLHCALLHTRLLPPWCRWMEMRLNIRVDLIRNQCCCEVFLYLTWRPLVEALLHPLLMGKKINDQNRPFLLIHTVLENKNLFPRQEGSNRFDKTEGKMCSFLKNFQNNPFYSPP